MERAGLNRSPQGVGLRAWPVAFLEGTEECGMWIPGTLSPSSQVKPTPGTCVRT